MISEKVKRSLRNSSAIRAMFEEGEKLRRQYGAENVFDFSLGNPDPEPPAETKAALLRLITEDRPGMHGYMNNAGYTDVRAKIAEKLNRDNGTELSAANIVMTCGAGGGLNVILKAILNPGEEVITVSPYFVEYGTYVDNFDGRLVAVSADPETFQPDIAGMEKHITAKTKAVIINTPNNPTGVVYKEEILRDMAELLARKEAEYGTVIFLISDEPYREIVYDGVKNPKVLDIFKNSVVAYSYSKSLSVPGERIGYIAASSRIDGIETFMNALIFANRALGFVNAPALFQRVIGEAPDAVVDVNIYKERRDLLYSHLTGLGFSCVKPEGAFYLFPRSPLPDTDEFKKMALKYNIILVPGKGFGCPSHFRLAYCVSSGTIRNALPAFTRLAEEVGLRRLS